MGQTYTAALNSGNDGNSGLGDSYVRTLNKGLSLLHPGDKLLMRGATYPESVQDNVPAGVDWAGVTSVEAWPGEQVTLAPSGVDTAIHCANGMHHIQFVNLNIDGAGLTPESTTNGVRIVQGPGPAAHHIRIKGGKILNVKGNGILAAAPGGGFNEYLGVEIDNASNNPSGVHGIYTLGQLNELFEDCWFHDNSSGGIQFSHSINPVGRRLRFTRNNFNIIYYSNSEGGLFEDCIFEAPLTSDLYFDGGLTAVFKRCTFPNPARISYVSRSTVTFIDCVGLGTPNDPFGGTTVQTGGGGPVVIPPPTGGGSVATITDVSNGLAAAITAADQAAAAVQNLIAQAQAKIAQLQGQTGGGLGTQAQIDALNAQCVTLLSRLAQIKVLATVTL